MAEAKTQKIDPIKITTFLATIARMENIVGNSLLTSANILEFLIQMKSILEHVVYVIGSYNALLVENQQIQKENEELKRRLIQYENAHTPPRVERDAGNLKQKKTTDDKPKKKQGGQPNHQGTTTVNIPDYESTAEFLEICECGEHRVTDIQDDGEIVQTDFEIIRKVIRYKRKTAKCVGCGKKRDGEFYNIDTVDGNVLFWPGFSLDIYTKDSTFGGIVV